MKILIASDIHGSATFCRQLMERVERENPDKLLLLGDLLYHGPRNPLPEGYAPQEVYPMLNSVKQKVIAVRGNCEAEVDQMVLEFPCMGDYATLVMPDRRTVFATHGHIFSPDKLPELPESSLFCFGHIHTKMLEKRGDIYILNPGSVTAPKDGSRSYAMLEDAAVTLKSWKGILCRNLNLNKNNG